MFASVVAEEEPDEDVQAEDLPHVLGGPSDREQALAAVGARDGQARQAFWSVGRFWRELHAATALLRLSCGRCGAVALCCPLLPVAALLAQQLLARRQHVTLRSDAIRAVAMAACRLPKSAIYQAISKVCSCH